MATDTDMLEYARKLSRTELEDAQLLDRPSKLRLVWKATPAPMKKQILRAADTAATTSGVKQASLTDMFLSKEKRNALKKSEGHFSGKGVTDWEEFLANSNRKSFVKAVQADPRADDKLRQHVDQMNRMQTGRPVATISGAGGRKYQVIRKRGGGLACTCPDWRYKKSVAGKGEQSCKHIKQYQESR